MGATARTRMESKMRMRLRGRTTNSIHYGTKSESLPTHGQSSNYSLEIQVIFSIFFFQKAILGKVAQGNHFQ